MSAVNVFCTAVSGYTVRGSADFCLTCLYLLLFTKTSLFNTLFNSDMVIMRLPQVLNRIDFVIRNN